MPPAAAAHLLREAVAAVRNKDKGRTRELLHHSLRLDPSNATAWQWLAAVAETPLDALAALEKVVALDPANDKAWANIAAIRLPAGIQAAKAKNGSAARRLLKAVVADDPKSEQGWLWLASVAESPADALAHLDRVLALNPDSAVAKRGVEVNRGRLVAVPGQAEPLAAGPHTMRIPRAVLDEALFAEVAQQAAAKKAVTASDITPLPQSAVAPPPGGGVRPSRGPAPRPGPAPKTVLVVDDSRTARKLAAMTLAAAGFRVAEAADGVEAVDRIRDAIPDLLVVDPTMPDMDGYELCRLIRGNPETKHIPVLFLTAKAGFFDRIRGRMAGVTLYLPKPLAPDALLSAARRYCPAGR